MQDIPLAIVLALTAAVVHGSWNVLLKTSGNPLRLSARATSAAAVIISPLAAIAWLVTGHPGLPPRAWLLVAISGLLELAYFIFLSRAYSRGELSAVYPLARGAAPLLAVLAGITLLGERLSPIALGGVVLLLAGIWAVRRPAPAGAGTIPALLTGVCIAAYSTVDAAGVQLTAPWLYGYLESVLTAALLALWVGVVHRTASDQPPPTWKLSALVGSMMTFAYLLVLFAFRIAPLAMVSPLRESAIVLVTIWGAWRLRERDGLWLRLAGASIIVLGVGLLATT